MTTQQTQTQTQTQAEFNAARRDDYNRGRGFKFLWAVYPDYWKKSWGDKPFLGTVRADSEFDAILAAYDYKLVHYSFSFGPEVKVIEPKAKGEKREKKERKGKVTYSHTF